MPLQDNIPPDPEIARQQADGQAAAHGDGQAATPPAARRARRAGPWRVARGVLLALGWILGLLLALVLLVLLALQTNWGARKAGDALIALANPFDDVTIDVGTIRGNWISHLELYDVNLTRSDSVRMVHVDTLRARYRLLDLLRGKIHVREVYAAGPTLALQQQADATWDLLDALGQDTTATDTTQPAFVFQIDRIRLQRGDLAAHFYAPGRDATLRIQNLSTRLDSLVIGADIALRLDALRAEVTPPGAAAPVDLWTQARLQDGRLALDTLRLDAPGSNVAAAGTLRLPDAAQDEIHDIDLALRAAPLAFADLAPFVPALAPTGSGTLEARLQGRAGLLHAAAEARFADGATLALDADATPGADAAVAYRLDARIRRLNPAFFTGDPAMRGFINADVQADLQGPSLDRLEGTARAVVFDTQYAEYAPERTTLHVAFAGGQAKIDLETGLRGATLALEGTARPFEDTPTYDLRGRLDHLDLGRFAEDAAQSSDVSGAFRLAGRGFDPQTAILTATLDLEASSINQHRLDAGALTARLADGRLDFRTQLRFSEGLAEASGEAYLGEVLRYQIREGRFENLDVTALAGDTTRSALTGTFALRGSGTDPATDLRLDEVTLTLTNSVYGPYHVHDARLGGTLRGGLLDLTARADLDGGTFDLAATARPFAAVPTFEVTRGDFAHVDVGKLTQNPDQRSDLNGAITRLTGRGFDPATMTLEARLHLDASRFNAQQIDGAQLIADLRRGALIFDARLDTPQGTTTLAGTANLAAAAPTVTLNSGALNGLNLGALLGLPGLDTELNGTFRALDLQGTDPRTMTFHADLFLERSRINSETLLDGAAQINLADGFARLGADLQLARGGARFTATGRLFDERPSYEAVGTLDSVNVGALAGIDTLHIDLSADFEIRGEGFEPATMTLAGRLDAADARYDSVLVSALHTRFRLADGLLAVDTLTVHSNVAQVEGSGPVALFDTLGRHASAFEIEADVFNLRPVRRLVGAEALRLGEGRLEGRLVGDPGTRLFEATASMKSLVYDDLRFSSLDAHAAADLGPDWKPVSGAAGAEANYFFSPALTVRYSEFKLDLANDSLRYTAGFTIDHRRDARLKGVVDLRPENQRATLDDLVLHLDNDRWALLQQASIAYGDEYRVSNFLVYSPVGDQQIAMDGVLDFDGNQSLILTIEQFRIGAVADLMGFQGLGGTLYGSLDLTGPAAAPMLKGTLNLDVQSFKEKVGTLRTDVRYDSLRLHLDAVLTHVDRSTMALRGYLPMDLRLSQSGGQDGGRAIQVTRQQADPASDVSLHLDADRFAIGWVLPFLDRATIDKIEGVLTADVRVGGTLESPALDGTVALEDGSLNLPELGATYTDIRAQAALAGDQVTLQHAEMRAGGGKATAQGTIDLTQLTLGQFDITIDADDFRAVNSRTYRAVTDADLRLRGTTSAPRLDGTVRLISADIYLSDETSASDFEPVQLTERDLEMLAEHFGIRVTEADTTTFDFYAALEMNLKVRMDRDVWLRSRKNPDMNIQFTGELDLQKKPRQDEEIFGVIAVIPERSYINQFGRRFDISKAPDEGITNTLTFNGPATDPVMRLQADYEVRSRGSQSTEIIIKLTVTGRLDNLQLDFASEPPTDLTNIISYIATGRPADKAFQLGGAGSGGALGTGAELAIGQLAGIVESAAGAELGLDVIEIQQEGLQGATITAGKYLSRRFYASVRWPISFNSGSQENTAGSSGSRRFTIEYELFNWLLASIVSDGSSIQVNLLYEYAY